MHKTLLLFVASVAVLASGNLHAETQGDGSYYLRVCSAAVKMSDGKELTQEENLGALYCVSYISGFLDSMSLTAKFTKGKRTVCTPERGVSNDQAVRLLVKYLRENPEILHESGRMSLYLALQKAFPCAK